MENKSDDYYLRVLIGVMSRKWTLLVVYSLRGGSKRYSEIYQSLPQITEKVLTETLRKLERDGCIERTVYPTVPQTVEYKLTELGESFTGKVAALVGWMRDNFSKLGTAQNTYDLKRRSDTSLRS